MVLQVVHVIVHEVVRARGLTISGGHPRVLAYPESTNVSWSGSRGGNRCLGPSAMTLPVARIAKFRSAVGFVYDVL